MTDSLYLYIFLSRRGGGSISPTVDFFAKTQKVFLLGSSNFLTFLTNTCPLPESSDILPKCLILPIPTSSHWISTFYDFLESLQITKATRLHNFFKEILHRRLQGEFAHFQFFLNTYLGIINFGNVFAHLNSLGQGLFKNKLLQFEQFLLAYFLFND